MLSVDVFEKLYDSKGVDVDVVELCEWRLKESGSSALHLACCYNFNLVKKILSKFDLFPDLKFSLLNCVNDIGYTPLHMCCRKELWKEAKFLLCEGADPNIPNSLGFTPLMTSVGTSTIPLYLTQLLCAFGADRNCGCIPLCMCITNMDTRQWLSDTMFYTTHMHFFEYIPDFKVVASLQAGEFISNRFCSTGALSALQIAEHDTSRPNALLIVKSQSWNANTHYLWPSKHRKRALDLVYIGYKMSLKYPRLKDVWIDSIVPFAMGYRVVHEQWSKLSICLRFILCLRRKSMPLS